MLSLVVFVAVAWLPAGRTPPCQQFRRSLNIFANEGAGGADDQGAAGADDDEAPIVTSNNLLVDADPARLGSVALIGAAALVPILMVAVATTMGMGVGSADNGGVGTPLSTEEVRKLTSGSSSQSSASAESPLTYEEAAEEQALVDVLRGGIQRAR